MNYPQFKKDETHVYKVISENLLVQVYTSAFDGSCEIQYLNNELIVNRIIGKTEILEAEFLETYYEVRKKLDDLALIKIDK